MTFVTNQTQRIAHQLVGLERVLGHVDDIDASRVTTVCAPAGYGKTVAMRQWADALSQRGRKVLWLATRTGINSVGRFMSALSSAFVQADLEFPALPPDTAQAAFVTQLMATQIGRPVLIVDDAHMLPPEVRDLLEEVVTTARDQLTTILAFRGSPTLQVARLHALGLLYEIGIADLRFTFSDITEFLGRNSQVTIDEPVVRQLVEDTHGWAAGIAMACARLRRSGQFSPRPMMGKILADFEQYFAEEVVQPQPETVQAFLATTAILDELTLPACAVLTGRGDCLEMLNFIKSAGVFVETVDLERNASVYHPLFRSMLLRRLSPQKANALHRSASHYYAGAEQPAKAIEHAAASGDQEFLAEQLDATAEMLTYAGFLFRIDELSSRLPASVVATRPMLLLVLAWRSIRRLGFSSAVKLIDTAEKEVARRWAAGDLDEFRYRHLQRHIEHRRIMLDAALDNMPKVEQTAEKLLTELGDDDAYLSCTLLAQLMAARRELYHFQDMQKLEAETRRALARPGSNFASISLKASVAPTLVVQGKTETARRMLEEALALAGEMQGEGSGLAALPALPLAELLYDCGEMAEARKLVDAHMAVARQWGFIDQLSAGYLVHARLLAAEGNVKAALASLDEANLIAIECGLDRFRALVMAEQVRILIRTGDHEQAQRVFDASCLCNGAEPLPTLNPQRLNETVAIAWLRLEITNNRLLRARKIAARWCELARRTGVLRSVVGFELLLAEIAALSGNRSEARRAVREAVELAAPAGWTRIFLDEGEVIGSLLTEAYGQGPVLDTPPDRLAARLVAAFRGATAMDPEENCGLASKLANRELDILGMVAGGLRNREIGNRLGLTEGTVKWYMQQIYDKLGVRRRPQAVTRARQLGMLG